MTRSRIEGDQTFAGDVTFAKAANFVGTVDLPNGTVVDADVSSGAKIQASKLINRHHLGYGQKDGIDVVSETKLLYIAHAAGTVQRVRVRPTTAPTGGDKKFTVDIQKASNASGTWTSLLTAVITVDSSSADDTYQDGSLIASPTLSGGDAVRVVITASGTTGSQGQGFVVSVHLDEDPS